MKAGRSVVVVIVVLVVMSLFAAVAFADNGAKATGQGKLNTGRNFSFQAQERSDGSIDGSGHLIFPSDLRIKYDITCLSVDGNVATMSGTMTSVVLPGEDVSEYVAGPFYFRVVDNGQGKNAAADQITYFLFDTPEYADGFPDCTEYVTEFEGENGLEPFPEVDIIAGNIQVKE